MPPADAPVSTGRTESQGLGITEAWDPPRPAQDARAAPSGTGNGAHVGRDKLPVSEAVAGALQVLGRQVAEAIASGDFERARKLTEEAIRRRAETNTVPDPVHGHGK